MDTCRPCGCKGCRTCLLCENEYGIEKNVLLNKEFGTYVYCPHCNKAFEGWDISEYETHPNHKGLAIDFPGVYINLDFLNEQEESQLIDDIDKELWDVSQSGRRKQNYGPKCNFKKRKLKLGEFKGFPKFSKFVQDKFQKEDILKDFITIEQCSLEYDPNRGASIDPHIDDCWIWGERIVTVNLLANSVLTMTYNSKPDYYNLGQVEKYPSRFLQNKQAFKVEQSSEVQHPVVRIPMPRRSLLVLFGSARYEWEHRVLREDVTSRRICLAYREFTPPYLNGGDEYAKSENILRNATMFI